MPATPSPRELSALIGAIYDCALDPTRWEPTLEALREAFNAYVAMIGLLDRQTGRLLLDRNAGLPPYWREQLAKHAPEIGSMVAAFGSTVSFDEPHFISRHIPASYRATSPYIQQCLRPQGIIDIMEYFLIFTPARFGGFGISRKQHQGPFTDRDIELGDILLPHIRRAVTISDLLDVRTIEHARMAETLDGLASAVLLTDARGAILYANRAAEDMLREGTLIQDTGGQVRASDAAAAVELRNALALAAQDESTLGKTGLALSLSGPGMAPVPAHVLPLNGSDLRTRLKPQAVAALFIAVPPDEESAAAAIAAAYGLTPAETRMLASLLAGRTLADTARGLGVAPTTARTHLQRIFTKTGTSRQAELMRLWARFSSPARPAGGASA